MSLDPQRAERGAPRRLQGSAEADYESGLLTLGEFIEVAYMVRCNLLYGSYDIRDDSDDPIILMTG